MVAATLRPAHWGITLVLAEADAASAPSQALLAGFGARRTGGTLEWAARGGALVARVR